MLFNYIFSSWSLGSNYNTQEVCTWTAGRQLSSPVLQGSSWVYATGLRASLIGVGQV